VDKAATAARRCGALPNHGGKPITIGAKTGTGDHRRKAFGPGGRLIGSRPVSRTATVVFFIGDAATCAKRGQKTPNGYYNLERMLTVPARSGEVGVCGTCMDARGITEEDLCESAHRSTLEQLTDWVQWADRTLVF